MSARMKIKSPLSLYMDANGVRQTDLAKALGMTQNRIWRICNGSARIRPFEQQAIAKALNEPVEKIFGADSEGMLSDFSFAEFQRIYRKVGADEDLLWAFWRFLLRLKAYL